MPAAAAGTHVTCYCRDCQTAARLHADGDDMLSPAGGSHIWQTTPEHVEIAAGAETLEIIRLSPNGLFRWHAACCGTPMMNTLPRLGLPFAGIVLRQSELAVSIPVIGKVRAHHCTRDARPGQGAPGKDRGLYRVALGLFRRMATAALAGRANPLRRDDGTPIAPVRIIPREERKAAMPAHLR